MPELPATVVFKRAGDMALICVDNPPVNALSSQVIAGLDQAMTAFENDPRLKLAVLYCAGRGFIAGADIRETPSRERSDAAAALINRMAASAKPMLAAIHGSALGGGLEAALACDYRCALEGSRLGLPEVDIGAVPGYGGTQRLPRLVGLETALRMMVTGAALDAPQALAAGLIDWLVKGNLLEEVSAIARELIDSAAPLRKTDWLPVPDGARAMELCAAALNHASRTRRGEEAPALIVECARQSVTLPISESLAYERRQSLARLHAGQCLAMRYLFFAERRAGKEPGVKAQARDVCMEMIQRLQHEARSIVAEGIAPEQLGNAFSDFGWTGAPIAVKNGHGAARPAVRSALGMVYRCMAVLQEAGQRALVKYPGLRPSDLDAEFCQSHGFPRYRGGPMYFAGHDESFGAYRRTGTTGNTTNEVHE